MHGVALLGGGIFARTAHLPAIQKVSDFALKAIWSRSESSVKALQEDAKKLSYAPDAGVYWEGSGSSDGDLAALLARKDVETVILSLPILGQPEIIRKAWEAGKHVISEKPVHKDIASAKELIALWEKTYKPKGLHWIIAEQWPYEPAFVEARKMLANGDLGDLRSFGFDFYAYNDIDMKYNKTAWRRAPEYQGGYLLDGGVHFFAGLRWALGGYQNAQITAVSAFSSQIQEHLPPKDTLTGILQTSAGVNGNFNISFGQEHESSKVYTFKGSKAVLTMSFEFNQGIGQGGAVWALRLFNKDKVLKEQKIESDGVPEEMKAFAKALVGGFDSPEAKEVYEKTSANAAFRDLALVEGALQSAETGKVYDLTS